MNYLAKVVEDNKEWMEEVFEAITHWDDTKFLGNNLRWVTIWDPLVYVEWSMLGEDFSYVRNCSCLDEDTSSWKNLKFVRVKIFRSECNTYEYELYVTLI